jgi:aspartate kinase
VKIAVLKFGGTSVETREARERICQHIETMVQEGFRAVVVVSAMGRCGAPYATDTLLDLLRCEFSEPGSRELDLVFSCGEILAASVVTEHLRSRGHEAVCLTGRQAGIITDSSFGSAEILEIDTGRILSHLEEGRIVVVTGGQGGTSGGEITSLGRGSSDITCCALGVALDASRIDVFTDVSGVMTADPRMVPEALLIDQISYSDCLSIARLGARVMHPRSVEIASQKPHIPLRVRSTFESHPGTLISHGDTGRPSLVVAGAGVATDKWARMSIVGIADRLPDPGQFISSIRAKGINARLSDTPQAVLTLLVPSESVEPAARVIHRELLSCGDSASH